MVRSLEQPAEDLEDLGLQAIAAETQRNQRIVMRPNRAVMIRHRVIAGGRNRGRPHSPTGEAARAEKCLGDTARASGIGDPGQQRVPGIRGDDPTGLLGPVERQRVGRQVFAPERRLEPFP